MSEITKRIYREWEAVDRLGVAVHAVEQLESERDELRAEVARLQDALDRERNLHGDTCGELESAIRHAQDLERQLAACQSLRRKHQRYALRQTGKLKEARAEIERMQNAIDAKKAVELEIIMLKEKAEKHRDNYMAKNAAARRALRELITALDRQHDPDGRAHHSLSVRHAMVEARKLLEAQP